MKIQLKNTTMTLMSVADERTLTLTPILRDSGGSLYRAATVTGIHFASTIPAGYYVDLNGLYAQGYRKVKFKANWWSGSSTIASGSVCTNDVASLRNDDDVVESYIARKSLNAIWFELPLTAESKCLHATYVHKTNESYPDLEVWTPTNVDVIASTRCVSSDGDVKYP